MCTFSSRFNSDLIILLFLINHFVIIFGIALNNNTDIDNEINWKSCNINPDDVEEAPWTAVLKIHRGDILEDKKFYPAAILNEYTIVTYGEAFIVSLGNKQQILPFSNYTVYISQSDSNTTNENDGGNHGLTNPIQVSYIKPYPGIIRDHTNWQKEQHDFILIYLKSPITFSSKVRPICLPDFTYASQFQQIIASSPNNTNLIGGWGKGIDLELISLRTTVKNYSECKSSWSSVAYIIGGAIIGSLCFVTIFIYVWIRLKKKVHSQHRSITDRELKEFHEGFGNPDDPCEVEKQLLELDNINGLFDVRKLKYDPTLEYLQEDCILGRVIGEGSFGQLRLAKLANYDKPIVVKTALAGGFRAGLVELKFMQYVQINGGHQNIVKLIGACTKELRSDKLQIAFEYCENGSILSFIRNNKSNFNNKFARCEPQYVLHVNVESVIDFSTLRLIQWALQVAQGMEFLVSKKIVHGDLAARNTLLTLNLDAKICDLGLSRQLYNYNVYTMKTLVPVPWRWMAIEVLETNTFNLKSDVWSYGVFLWELFNLGIEPWCTESYGPKFVEKLKKQNMRLDKPEFCNDEIFNVMKDCWNCLPEARPEYLDIIQTLQNVSSQLRA